MDEPAIETIAIHGGYTSDSTRAVAVPIYQTVAHDFVDADHAGAIMDLETPGFHYNRINNPTVDVLEQRMAALEGGKAALAVSSGSAAVTMSVLNLLGAGDNLVSVPQLDDVSIRRVASSPSISGMYKSMSVKSGRCWRKLWIASRPFVASATSRISGSASRIAAMPSRTSGWSSTLSRSIRRASPEASIYSCSVSASRDLSRRPLDPRGSAGRHQLQFIARSLVL